MDATTPQEAAVYGMPAPRWASVPAAEVAQTLGTDLTRGLTAAEAARRLVLVGPNTVVVHRARFWPLVARQLASPLMALLLVAAVASFFVGERSDAVVIGLILALSAGLGVGNEYRAEKQAEALHDRVRHTTVVVRDGRPLAVDVTALVPGDVVKVGLGDIVPADLRLSECLDLACNESILTGESLGSPKAADPVPEGSALGDLSSSAFMGTIVEAGSGRGLVVSTGRRTEFGKIAAGVATPLLETEFQRGLRAFSMLLVYVAGALSIGILVLNVLLRRPLLDALLFSLAIAVGITPQLLPAVVSTSLAAGAARLAQVKVLVKRLICIEDLGDVETLFTDKTGTLTEGRVTFSRTLVGPAEDVLLWGLLSTENLADGGVGGNPLDRALWEAPAASAAAGALAAYTRVHVVPFDHQRQMTSAVVRDGTGTVTLVTKGAPEAVLARCVGVPADAAAAVDAEFRAGSRVVAVATRELPAGAGTASVGDEHDLSLRGLLVFLDPPKSDAPAALARLDALGVSVKIVTGDNAVVANKVCRDLGIRVGGTLTGAEIGVLADAELAERIGTTTVFARVSPEDKARVVRLRRQQGRGVAFLGDGVNDALALHAADVGISVDTATDVAKDAADIILLEKSLAVLADGVAEGRRIFGNTIKYVLMGTSSNFGNMFSAAGASLFLPFLPMLPSQILLNNLLYDASQLAIPTDRVDPEQLQRPSHWDIRFIRRFMVFFGPVSSAFDALTFWMMLSVFHAGPALFQSGWFVESLATQTLIIFAIRTRRVPFLRSRASVPLTSAVLTVVVVGAVLPMSPLAGVLGFSPLPVVYFLALVGMVVAYLILVEAGKRLFYRSVGPTALPPPPPDPASHARIRIRRRSAHFTTRNRSIHRAD